MITSLKLNAERIAKKSKGFVGVSEIKMEIETLVAQEVAKATSKLQVENESLKDMLSILKKELAYDKSAPF
jgi:hypothetical protein